MLLKVNIDDEVGTLSFLFHAYSSLSVFESAVRRVSSQQAVDNVCKAAGRSD